MARTKPPARRSAGNTSPSEKCGRGRRRPETDPRRYRGSGMNRIMKFVLCAVIVTSVGASGIWFYSNSARDARWLCSASRIERSLRKALPLGSSREGVEAYFKSRDATIISSSTEAGFLSRDQRTIGTGHVRVRLGGYKLLLMNVDVTATAGFDIQGRLVGLEVGKYTDSL